MFDCKTHRSILACLRPNQEEHPFRIRLGAPIIFSMKSFYKKNLKCCLQFPSSQAFLPHISFPWTESNANKPYATSTSSCYLLSLLKQTSSSVVHLACYYLPFGTPSSDKHVFNHAGTE